MNIPLAGSKPRSLTDAQDLGPVDPNAEAEVTVVLCGKMSEQQIERELGATSTQPVSERKYLTREELAERRGAKPEDIQRVQTFARNHNLSVIEADPARRTVKLRGTLADLQAAFGVELRIYDKGGMKFRSHRAPVSLPGTVAGAIQAVLGLDNFPVAKR